jgi:hypothetical protein
LFENLETVSVILHHFSKPSDLPLNAAYSVSDFFVIVSAQCHLEASTIYIY